MPTFCQNCIHLMQTGASEPPWKWMCSQHKRLEGFGFVTQDKWDKFPPYLYCKDVNGGDCPLYEKALSSEEQAAKREEFLKGRDENGNTDTSA